MFDRRRPNEPQVAMGFHGRERVAAVDQLLRRQTLGFVSKLRDAPFQGFFFGIEPWLGG